MAAKSGGLGKLLLIVGLLFVAIVGIGIAGVVFVAYKAKNAVQEVARKEGIELGDLVNETKKGKLRGEPCSFLSASEASAILGASITRAENSGTVCNYYIARSEQDRSQSVDQALEKLKTSKGDDEGLKGIERVTKEIVGSVNDGSTPFLMIQYNEDGTPAMTGYKIAMRAMGAVDKVTGVGDEALAGPMGSTFIFMKDNIAVHMDLRQIPQGREKGIEMGKLIASRL